MEKLILDSDVLLNWLMMERETVTGQPLWIAPSTIIELSERGVITTCLSYISIMEIRYVLRRKRNWADLEIERDLKRISQLIHYIIPDSEQILQANALQSEAALDPFDSLILTQALHHQCKLITRDQLFLETSNKYIDVFTPEAYVQALIGSNLEGD